MSQFDERTAAPTDAATTTDDDEIRIDAFWPSSKNNAVRKRRKGRRTLESPSA